MRLSPQLSLGGILLGSGVGAWACMQATHTYPVTSPSQPGVVGSLSVERIEGGQRLLVLSLSELPPPERLAPGLTEFVVWVEGPHGNEVKVGALHYDRARRSGNLLGTTDLTSFTVRVTGERDGRAEQPSDVLLAERHVVTN